METSLNPYKKVKDNVKEMNNQDYGDSPPYSALQQEPIMPSSPSMHINVGNSMGGGMMPLNYNPPVGPDSTELSCPQCRCRIKTKVRHRSTTKTHITCLLLSWTLCCCCLPYCMDSCRNANHFCPMCGAFIGTYQS